jgi:hypothetical protein
MLALPMPVLLLALPLLDHPQMPSSERVAQGGIGFVVYRRLVGEWVCACCLLCGNCEILVFDAVNFIHARCVLFVYTTP